MHNEREGIEKDETIIPTIYYCFDPYCGWCYGFSNVMTQLADAYKGRLVFDALSGGMTVPGEPQSIAVMASYMQTTSLQVEAATGIAFGPDFRWHIDNPEESDWYPDATKAAIALCIFKEYYPDRAVYMAADLQYALNFEGRDLTDDEAYRHLLHQYLIPEADFYAKLKSEAYKEKAYNEFALVKQLQVTGFPTLLMQITASKLYLLARGYTDYQTVQQRIDTILQQIKAS